MKQEAPREEAESPFTSILRDLFSVSDHVLAAVYADAEGEAVDYCSVLSSYETKLTAAYAVALCANIGSGLATTQWGRVQGIEVEFARRVLLIRPVSEEYLLLVWLDAQPGRSIFEATERARLQLREESVLERPPWEPIYSAVVVETRNSMEWGFAPRAFVQQGTRIRVMGVLGRWQEPGRTCFRVRTSDGREVTLSHQADQMLWSVLAESQ